jgi:hypothetical protein
MACNLCPGTSGKCSFEVLLGRTYNLCPGRSADSLSRFCLWHVICALGYLADALSRFCPMACNLCPGRSDRLGCVPVISPGMLLRGFAMTTCNLCPGRSDRLSCVLVISPGMLLRGFVVRSHIICALGDLQMVFRGFAYGM